MSTRNAAAADVAAAVIAELRARITATKNDEPEHGTPEAGAARRAAFNEVLELLDTYTR